MSWADSKDSLAVSSSTPTVILLLIPTCDHAWHWDAEHTNYLYRLRRSIRYRLSNYALPSEESKLEAQKMEEETDSSMNKSFGTVYLRVMVLRPKGIRAAKVNKSKAVGHIFTKSFIKHFEKKLNKKVVKLNICSLISQATSCKPWRHRLKFAGF